MVKLGKRLHKSYKVERECSCVVCREPIKVGNTSELTEVIRKRDSYVYWGDAHPDCLSK